MRYLLTSEQMKACDRMEIEHYGTPSVVLMERAALAVRDAIFERFSDASKVLVICGSGNNGGDGFAVARMLILSGRRADVLFVGKHDHMTQETRLEADIFTKHGGTVLPDGTGVDGYDLIVDALFGTGLSRDVLGRYADLINAVNMSGTPVVAVDIPSGINADDGHVMGCAVMADVTVTMAFAKLGQMLYPGAKHCGEVIVADIGITPAGLTDGHGGLNNEFNMAGNSAVETYNRDAAPDNISDESGDMLIRTGKQLPGSDKTDSYLHEPVISLESGDLKGLLPRRRGDANKGTYGKLLLIAGTRNMAGAAVLAGKAAYRAGCGLVCIYSHEENRNIIQTSVPEAIFAPWGDDISGRLAWADAVAIGPGLGQEMESLEVLTSVFENWHGPLVIDADALNLMAAHPKLRPSSDVTPVITPHPGEMARLLRGRDTSKRPELSEGKPYDIPDYATAAANFSPIGISSHPVRIATGFAQETGFVTVLKGARTVVTDGEDIYLNLTGNEGMATGGSGDTLTGIIGSLLAQGLSPFEASKAGVLLHGMAGDEAAKKLGTRSMTAADISDYIPRALEACFHQN